MATISQRQNKDGTISFCIRVSDGYDTSGKQIKRPFTWRTKPGMTPKQIQKELQRQTVMFEEQVKTGQAQQGNIKFADFSEKWMQEYATKKLKVKTYTEYGKSLPRINEAIGHIRLQDLRTGHLNSFYTNLQEDGINRHTGGKLAPNSVRAYHRIISSILTKAVKWGYIPYNPAINAELPKLERKEAPHLDEDDARRLLILLQDEPIKYRAMITFDMLSGLRRGELLGLQWQDIDFDNQTIYIRRTLSYASGVGLYTDTPKNITSSRPLKLSPSVFSVLMEYKTWQDNQREVCGTYWKNNDNRVFTADDGGVIHPDSLTKWFRHFVDRSGLPKVTIHSLRHTYASLMIADGTPLVVVSKRLGHAQVSTTANIYAHVISSADEKASMVSEKFADVISTNTNKTESNPA